MYIFVLLIHIVVSLVLVAVILLQAGRGGGLAETFGGGGGSQMTLFGQKASTFLTKATTVSAVLFLCTSLSLAVISSKRQKSIMEGARIPQAQKTVLPEDLSDIVEEAKGAGKTVVRHVEVDPVTGKETVTMQEATPTVDDVKTAEDKTLPATEKAE